VITLYGSRASPFTEKVARGLAFKKLEFVLVEPESAEDYRRWNPATGTLPVIDLHGERVHESTTILLRVNELLPEPPLLSDDSRTAQNQLRLARWVDETFFWYWNRWMRRAGASPLVGPFHTLAGESLTEAERRIRDAELPRPTGVSLRSWVAARVRGSSESARGSEEERLLQEACHRVDDLARLLAPRPFFFADRVSIADLGAYAMLRSLALDCIPGTRRHLERQPALLDFMGRVEQETGSADLAEPEAKRGRGPGGGGYPA
jgi:glutathione S-transferase